MRPPSSRRRPQTDGAAPRGRITARSAPAFASCSTEWSADGAPPRPAPHPGAARRALRRALPVRRLGVGAARRHRHPRIDHRHVPAVSRERTGSTRAIVRWAVNTHCDFDHTGGNGALKAALPHVQIMAHRLDQGLTEDVQRLIDERYGEFRATDGFDDPPETTAYLRSVTDLVPLDVVLSGGEEFDLGGRSVRVLHVPGHSPGSRRRVRCSEPRRRDRRCDARHHGAVRGRPRRLPADVSGRRALRRHRSRRSAPLDVDLVLTAHYPIYEGAGRDRVPRRERAVHARDRRRADATCSLVPTTGSRRSSSCGPRGRGWAPGRPGALDYSVFPVTGNLERMRDAGLVASRSTPGGRRRWSRVATREPRASRCRRRRAGGRRATTSRSSRGERMSSSSACAGRARLSRRCSDSSASAWRPRTTTSCSTRASTPS